MRIDESLFSSAAISRVSMTESASIGMALRITGEAGRVNAGRMPVPDSSSMPNRRRVHVAFMFGSYKGWGKMALNDAVAWGQVMFRRVAVSRYTGVSFWRNVMSRSIYTKLHFQPGAFLRIGGAHDALSAVLLERAGFPALWVSGFALSAAQFAMPDVNLVSLTESVDATRRICEAVRVPVIVDADNGFGDETNAYRAVREFGMAGAAGVCIEDNTFPKRCSLYPGAPRELVSIEEMSLKLKAAKRAAEPFGIVLIGRVESLIADLGVADAIERANAYADAGADVVLIHSKKFAPLRDIAKSGRVKKPLITVPTLFGDTSFEEMAECGIAGAILANQMLRSMVYSCQPMASKMLAARSLAALDGSLVKVSDINNLVKVPTDWSEGTAPAPVSSKVSPDRSPNVRPTNGDDLAVLASTVR
jgi:phosphoenolpyruvate phosphomutase